jgi:GH15 family glucan-1,4-alpha-glucosidase
VQSYGAPHLDASLLLISKVGFLPPDDPRVRGTVEAIQRNLVVDGLVLRYSTATAVWKRRNAPARKGSGPPPWLTHLEDHQGLAPDSMDV